MTHFNIQITSDTVCPWCYIGLRRLQRAIATYQKTYPGGSRDEFHLTWLPFYLDQTAPAHSVAKRTRMIERRGSEEAAERGIVLLKKVGMSEGIDFNWDGWIGSTRLSHRVITFAGTKGGEVQTSVVEAIFRGHFEETWDITEREDLVVLAGRGGLEEQEVRELLREGGDDKVIDAEAKKARAEGIRGVPRFLVNGEVLDGAQDSSDFFELFVKLKAREN